MSNTLKRTLSPIVIAIAALGGAAGTVGAADRSVSLVQDPVIMRLSNDEFRIAFGIDAAHCADKGCNGTITYRVEWKTEGGASRVENKRVNYTVAPNATRTITVDRAYFDTAEGQHVTDVINVRVQHITCAEGTLTSL